MSRKIKNMAVLFGILLFIVATGSIYSFVYQKGRIQKQDKKIASLRATEMNPDSLKVKLKQVRERTLILDSVLSSRKFNIPQMLAQTNFYDFVRRISASFSIVTHINIEYKETKPEKSYNYYSYKISGTGEFNDIYRLVYGIEQSKELKKVKNLSMTATVFVDKEAVSHHLVNFDLTANVYFSNDNRFSTSQFVENQLEPKEQYNFFYPLIRNDLPPNTDGLADVNEAKLLALVPDGAFISDAKGNTYILVEGDPVYLGYLTKIDYETNEVTFILNRGGIIENVFLKLEKEDNRKKIK
ncbi:MAG: hypothetical protein WCJ01_00815 [Ignavibacteria bacterium]